MTNEGTLDHTDDRGGEPILSVSPADPLPDSSVVVTLHGELDLATRPVITHVLQPLVAQRCPRLVLDLSGVTFVDGSGLSALLDTARSMARHEGIVVLRGIPRLLDLLLEATSTRPMFHLESDDSR